MIFCLLAIRWWDIEQKVYVAITHRFIPSNNFNQPRAVGVWLFMLSTKLCNESRIALLIAFLKLDRVSIWASQFSSCFVVMGFLQARRASFQRLAGSEFHQMLSFLRSDFRIRQAALYDLVITEWTLFSRTSIFLSLLLRKVLVLVVKIVHLTFVRVRLHICSST